MKVCLINPSRLMKPLSATMKPSPPLGLAFIAAVLKQLGHTVQVIDAMAEGADQYVAFKNDIVLNGLTEKQVAARIQPDTDVIGFSLMFSGNWLHHRILINYIGEQFPNALLIAGGEHVTAVPEFCMQQATRLNVCILGEGEETVARLFAVLNDQQDLDEVPGIAYRSANGQFKLTPTKERIRELESIPWPAWEYFPLVKYKEHGITLGVEQESVSFPVLATRGCPYECTFCSSPQMWGTRYFMRSVSDVANEIEYLKNNYGGTNFDFYDLTAIINKRWIIDFAKELINRNLNITWQIPAGTRSEAIDREVAYYLYKSGCRNITYAPESGSEAVLQHIRKKVSLPKMLTSISYSSREKMNIKINMILGFPDEKHQHIFTTMLFLLKASWKGVNDMAPSVFSPYPGSALFKRLEEEGKIDLSNDEYFYQIIYVDTFFSNSFYNTRISKHLLRFYLLSYLFIFYSSNFLFHPTRLYRTLRNVLTNRFESRGEMALGELIKRSKIRVLNEEQLALQEVPQV